MNVVAFSFNEQPNTQATKRYKPRRRDDNDRVSPIKLRRYSEGSIEKDAPSSKQEKNFIFVGEKDLRFGLGKMEKVQGMRKAH